MQIRTISNTHARSAPAEGRIIPPEKVDTHQAASRQTVQAVSGVGEVQYQQAESSVTSEDAREMVRSISLSLETIASGLQFQVDEDSGEVIVKMIDKQSGEVLKQIPTEDALKIAKSLSNLTGLILKESA